MTDIVDRTTRSRMMSGIKGRDTKPELIVRKYLHAHGLRFRLAPKNLPGKPDIVLSKYRTVVFVHGCFWHRHPGCEYTTVPTTNAIFWRKKFRENTKRDLRVQKLLQQARWRVIILWECELSQRRLGALKEKITFKHPRA